MAKFNVTVCRTSYSFITLTVESENEQDATDKALESAGDYEFSESSADYTVETIIPTDEDENHHPDCPAIDGFSCHCDEL